MSWWVIYTANRWRGKNGSSHEIEGYSNDNITTQLVTKYVLLHLLMLMEAKRFTLRFIRFQCWWEYCQLSEFSKDLVQMNSVKATSFSLKCKRGQLCYRYVTQRSFYINVCLDVLSNNMFILFKPLIEICGISSLCFLCLEDSGTLNWLLSIAFTMGLLCDPRIYSSQDTNPTILLYSN